MSILDKAPMPGKLCAVIFLLDTSYSMQGAPIGAVNAAIENILPELISMNDEQPDSDIKVGILTFDTEVKWIFGESGLVPPKDVQDSWIHSRKGNGTIWIPHQCIQVRCTTSCWFGIRIGSLRIYHGWLGFHSRLYCLPKE